MWEVFINTSNYQLNSTTLEKLTKIFVCGFLENYFKIEKLKR